jgi:hypothetical protein
MKHTRYVTKWAKGRLPAPATPSFVCGRFIFTGKIKCVPTSSPKAPYIKDVPIS